MKNTIKSALLITTAFFFASASDVISSQSSSPIETPINIPLSRNAPAEINQILAALEQRKSGQHGALATKALTMYQGHQFPVAKIPVHQARAAKDYYNTELQTAIMKKQHQEEVQMARSGVDNPEALRRLAEQLLQGAASFVDLLVQYPFMIGTAENDVIVSEGLRKTKEQIESVEAQDAAYREDMAIRPLHEYLQLPEIIQEADSSNNIDRLKNIVKNCIEQINIFIGTLNDHTPKLKNKYFEFYGEPITTPTRTPLKFMLKLLTEIDSALKLAPAPSILALNEILTNNLQNIAVAFKILLLLDANGGEKQKYIAITMDSLKADYPELMKALSDLSLEINNMDKRQGGHFKDNMANFKARQSNVLLGEIANAPPQALHTTLQQNSEYFTIKPNPGFNPETIALFKRKAGEKDKFLSNSSFIKIFQPFRGDYEQVINLRISSASRDIQPAWYADSNKIEAITALAVIGVIDDVLKAAPPGQLPNILLGDIINQTKDHFSDLQPLENLAREKVDQQFKKKNPILDVKNTLYNAQYAHAHFVERMGNLKTVIGNKLNDIEEAAGPIESRAVVLRDLCRKFTEAPYYTLESQDRALKYVLVLGAFASERVWITTFRQPAQEALAIVNALTQARNAYLAARTAIQALANISRTPVPLDSHPPLWKGFEIPAGLLPKFDPAHLGGAAAAAPIPGAGAPPPPPGAGAPPPPPGAGGVLQSPIVQLNNKMKRKLSAPQYEQACRDFLNDIVNNWEKLDYAPTLDDWTEKARLVYNAGGGPQHPTLQAFKAFLDQP